MTTVLVASLLLAALLLTLPAATLFLECIAALWGAPR